MQPFSATDTTAAQQLSILLHITTIFLVSDTKSLF